MAGISPIGASALRCQGGSQLVLRLYTLPSSVRCELFVPDYRFTGSIAAVGSAKRQHRHWHRQEPRLPASDLQAASAPRFNFSFSKAPADETHRRPTPRDSFVETNWNRADS